MRRADLEHGRPAELRREPRVHRLRFALPPDERTVCPTFRTSSLRSPSRRLGPLGDRLIDDRLDRADVSRPLPECAALDRAGCGPYVTRSRRRRRAMRTSGGCQAHEPAASRASVPAKCSLGVAAGVAYRDIRSRKNSMSIRKCRWAADAQTRTFSYVPSFLLSNSLTACGFALPPVRFMT